MSLDVDRPKVEEKSRFEGKCRFMRVEDLESVRPILETWIRHWKTGEVIASEVEQDLGQMKGSIEGSNEGVSLVAETHEGEVVGVIGLKPPDERMLKFTTTDKPAELIHAYVAREHRGGKGVGRALVNQLEREAIVRGYKEMVLNSGPRYEETGWGFYDRLEGYTRMGVAKDYYGAGIDAPVWRKVL